MDVGVFDKVCARPTLAATLDAVAALGLRDIQFHAETAGLPALPEHVPGETIAAIRHETSARGIRIAAVSATYNMAHPDPRVRERGLAGLRALAAACPGMGASVLTLCTGTRDPEDMWRPHPDNGSPAAWRDLLGSMEAALAIAEEHGVTLAFEPEPANVVNSIARAHDLLRAFPTPRLGIVMDGANITATASARPPADVLDEAFDALGGCVAVAHTKDRLANGTVVPAGQGVVPWDRFVSLLAKAEFEGPLILHSLSEEALPGAVFFLSSWTRKDPRP